MNKLKVKNSNIIWSIKYYNYYELTYNKFYEEVDYLYNSFNNINELMDYIKHKLAYCDEFTSYQLKVDNSYYKFSYILNAYETKNTVLYGNIIDKIQDVFDFQASLKVNLNQVEVSHSLEFYLEKLASLGYGFYVGNDVLLSGWGIADGKTNVRINAVSNASYTIKQTMQNEGIKNISYYPSYNYKDIIKRCNSNKKIWSLCVNGWCWYE